MKDLDVLSGFSGLAKLGLGVAVLAIVLIILITVIRGLAMSIIRVSTETLISKLLDRFLGAARREIISPAGRLNANLPAPAPANPHRPDPTLRWHLEQLKRDDPLFSEQRFKDHALTTHRAVVQAIETMDLAPLRLLVTPSLLTRLNLELVELQQKRWKRRFDHLRVGTIEIVEVKRDGPYHHLTVSIEVAGEDYVTDPATGAIVAGRRGEQDLSARLVFLRSDQVKTREETETLTQKCPSCGAPIAINALGKCNYCGTEVSTGLFSWVLSELAGAARRDQGA